MIVADTSALITLSSADILKVVLEEFDVHTSETVVRELEETTEYDDIHGEAAEQVLQHQNRVSVHEARQPEFQSSRIDQGEGTCVNLARDLEVEFLITDDLRALPELQTLANAHVAISPIVLKALVERDRLSREEALKRLGEAADNRDWLESPIYRRAKHLFRDQA